MNNLIVNDEFDNIYESVESIYLETKDAYKILKKYDSNEKYRPLITHIINSYNKNENFIWKCDDILNKILSKDRKFNIDKYKKRLLYISNKNTLIVDKFDRLIKITESRDKLKSSGSSFGKIKEKRLSIKKDIMNAKLEKIRNMSNELSNDITNLLNDIKKLAKEYDINISTHYV